jgi:hypothetical protein
MVYIDNDRGMEYSNYEYRACVYPSLNPLRVSGRNGNSIYLSVPIDDESRPHIKGFDSVEDLARYCVVKLEKESEAIKKLRDILPEISEENFEKMFRD